MRTLRVIQSGLALLAPAILLLGGGREPACGWAAEPPGPSAPKMEGAGGAGPAAGQSSSEAQTDVPGNSLGQTNAAHARPGAEVSLVKSIKVLTEQGGRVDWCHKLNLIASDRKGSNGYYDVYTMAPDGSNVQGVTEHHPDLPHRHAGQPAWHPSGEYLLFQAEKAQPAGAMFVDVGAHPGAGVYNDLWVMNWQTRTVTRVVEVPNDGNHGTLHPHFRDDGRKLSWSEMYEAAHFFTKGKEFGLWRLKVADFSVGPDGPVVTNVREFQPLGEGFYENHGFSPDGRKLIFTTNAKLQDQSAYRREDICVLDLEKNEVATLTSANYNEHAIFSPDGRHIIWMSNADNPNLGTDYWIMNADGSGKQRLTFFNQPGRAEYNKGVMTLAADFSWGPDGRTIVAYYHTGLDGREVTLLIELAPLALGIKDSKPSSPAPAGGFVHADGTTIRDENNKQIHLRGVNLGGWLLWEGWIWGGGFDGESAMMRRLESLVGAEAAETFRNDVHSRFVGQEDIARVAEMGFNVVRVPLNYRVLEDDARPSVYKDSGWRILDSLLDLCEKHHVYVVPDLHSAPGGQSKWFVADPDPKNLLWDSESNQARTVALWKAIAARYKDRRIIAGYDLLNEPAPPDGKTLVAFYHRLMAAVREVDPHHMIIVEGADFARDFSMFAGPLDGNQAYSFHIYTWFWDDRKKRLGEFRDLAKQHCVPLWNGEFGENKYDMLKSTVAMFEEPESLVSGYCFWTWKKAPNKNPGLLSIRLPANWKDLISWVSGDWLSRKPTQDEAAAAAKDFLSAGEFGQNQEDPKMREILAPQ